MDNFTLPALLDFLSKFGLSGVVFLVWYLDSRAHEKTLKQYHEDMQEIRGMYENNVALVKSYESIARDLREIVILNTQKWSQASLEIIQNQYCPMVRLEKKAAGPAKTSGN